MQRTIRVSLEAFQYVVAGSEPGRSRRAGSRMGTCAAAAEEEHQGFFIHLLFHGGDKVGVGFHAGVSHPFNFDRAGDAPDPVKLGAAADIYQLSPGR